MDTNGYRYQGPRGIASLTELKGVFLIDATTGASISSVEDDVTKRGDKRVGVCVQGYQKTFHTRHQRGALYRAQLGGRGHKLKPPSKSYMKKVA